MKPSREQPPYPVHRQVFGWMVGHDPTDLYVELKHPTIANLPTAVHGYASSYVYAGIAHKSHQGPVTVRPKHINTYLYGGQALDALMQSVRDVSRMTVLGLAAVDPRLHSTTASKDATFLETLSGIATLPQEDITNYFHAQSRKLSEGTMTIEQFTLDAHVVAQEDPDESRGCPFAKNQPNTSRRDRLFDRFVKWAADLSIAAINDDPNRLATRKEQ